MPLTYPAHPMGVTWDGVKRALHAAYRDLLQHHAFQMAAALSYYLVLAVFPGLIVLSALVGSIRGSGLFTHVLNLMSQMIPSDSMRIVRSVLHDVLGANPTAWISLGMLGMIWVASTAFEGMIEALNIAYDVRTQRPFWKTRLLAIGLAAMTGILLLSSLAVQIVGPRFGQWLATRVSLSRFFVFVWPTLHWTIAVGCTVLAVELLYFLAPDVKQRFAATLPGAVLAVACWICLSSLLGFYFRHVANFSKIYGTLAGFIAFMTWFYWNSFALLVGAELNAELAKQSAKGRLPQKAETISPGSLDRAA